MKAIGLILLAVLVCGCDGPSTVVDQCLRREIFESCLAKAPAGPTAAHYNDWSEVISECSSTAYYTAQRKRVLIKPECQP
jgi:hypothetical protein